MTKVVGVGGVFFKANNASELNQWYAKHLGLKTDEHGAMFESRDADNPEKKTYLQWSTFKSDTKYFSPSEKQFMINYRVEDLESLAKELREQGVTIVDEIEVYDYGKFLHIMDPEGNKIELWEPIDKAFESAASSGPK